MSLVVFVFAAFGGVLTNLAPPSATPGDTHNAAIGLASLIALILLLAVEYVVAMSPKVKSARLILLVAAIIGSVTFVFTALNYRSDFATSTFMHDPDCGGERGRFIMGSELTPAAKIFSEQRKTNGPDDLMCQAGATLPTEIWTRDSILRAEARLVRNYQVLVISLTLALFTLSWLVILTRGSHTRAR